MLAGGAMPRDSALALYRESSAPGAAEREWKTRVAHQASLITTGLRVRSPDTLLNRPGFGWFFGGDASINSFAMNAVGQSALVRDGALCFFARDQRADGKLTHEMSQGAATSTGSAIRIRSITATRVRSGSSHSVNTGSRPMTLRC